MITHKKGEYIGLASGEYSDYRFNGLYRTLLDVDLADCAQRYYDAAPVCEWDDELKEADDCGLGAWLIANGIVEEIPYDEVHCGSYGTFEIAEVVEHANTRGRELLAANYK